MLGLGCRVLVSDLRVVHLGDPWRRPWPGRPRGPRARSRTHLNPKGTPGLRPCWFARGNRLTTCMADNPRQKMPAVAQALHMCEGSIALQKRNMRFGHFLPRPNGRFTLHESLADPLLERRNSFETLWGAGTCDSPCPLQRDLANVFQHHGRPEYRVTQSQCCRVVVQGLGCCSIRCDCVCDGVDRGAGARQQGCVHCKQEP